MDFEFPPELKEALKCLQQQVKFYEALDFLKYEMKLDVSSVEKSWHARFEDIDE